MRLMSPYSVKLRKNRNTTTIKTKNHFSYNNLTTNTKKEDVPRIMQLMKVSLRLKPRHGPRNLTPNKQNETIKDKNFSQTY